MSWSITLVILLIGLVLGFRSEVKMTDCFCKMNTMPGQLDDILSSQLQTSSKPKLLHVSIPNFSLPEFLMRILELAGIYRWVNWNSERLSDLSILTQLIWRYQENQSWMIVKAAKTDFIQKSYCCRGEETTVENWVRFWIQQEKVGVCSQGAEWGAVNGKLLHQEEVGEGFWLNLTGFLLKLDSAETSVYQVLHGSNYVRFLSGCINQLP